jgi:hypothetical protein
MREIVEKIRIYFREADKRILALSALFTALLIFINYYFGLNEMIFMQEKPFQYLSWYLVFLMAFGFPYVLLIPFQKKNLFRNKKFTILFFLAPVLFAWKMAADIEFNFTDDPFINDYWNRVLYYPAKLVIITIGLMIIWYVFDRKHRFYGTDLRNFHPRPYFIMLLIMLPLIAAASTQPDFLAMYPKLNNVSHYLETHPQAFYKLLYELSYGIDFVGIELYFRGFLILAFIKWAGKDAILPMAVFYCTIHFGKPIGECISSFFGGIILGVVTYHTRTILGGLMVHLGIAWLMELGGYLGNLYIARPGK